ncbi:hypothetical protein F0562_015775 [Nyssa sinensis]|uniref:Uncharacterized protein n=1 Tax=Nyssa sinensis TaxID=561372 RepID=A0A5J4ZLD9_9ASTE|nr:hypothetical protein F0562_015775 [Nyssa sinensis]
MRNPSSSLPTTTSTSKTTTPCCSKVGLKRGPWTPEEDEVLANYIKREGEGRWRTLPKRAGLLRCGKSCRLRWMNYLRPSVKRGPIAPDEEDLILRLHRLLGNRWALIAGRIPGHQSPTPTPTPAPTPTPNPNPNPNPNFSRLQQNDTLVNKSDEGCKGTNLDRYPNPVVNSSDENWQNSVGLMTGLQSSTHGNHGNEEPEIEFCNDDTFSSFLNSIINEDVFANQHYHQGNIVIAPSSSQLPAIPSIQTFNHGTIWEAALTSSKAALGDEQDRSK